MRFLFCLSVVLTQSASQDEPDSLTHRLEAALAATHQLSFHCSTKVEVDAQRPEFAYEDGNMKATVLRCGDREKIVIGPYVAAGDAPEVQYSSEYIIEPNGSIICVQGAIDADGQYVANNSSYPLILMLSHPDLAQNGAVVRNRSSTLHELTDDYSLTSSGC